MLMQCHHLLMLTAEQASADLSSAHCPLPGCAPPPPNRLPGVRPSSAGKQPAGDKSADCSADRHIGELQLYHRARHLYVAVKVSTGLGTHASGGHAEPSLDSHDAAPTAGKDTAMWRAMPLQPAGRCWRLASQAMCCTPAAYG
jgi:hypothetical protein